MLVEEMPLHLLVFLAFYQHDNLLLVDVVVAWCRWLGSDILS